MLTGMPAQTVTTSVAAAVLGVTPQNLRRWIREGKFNALGEVEWDRSPGFRRQRTYSKEWIEAAAKELSTTPDWSVLPSLELKGS
jgi:hypothetical protein